jgi:hypothetical protein
MPTGDELNKAAPDTRVFVLHLYNRALLNRAALRAVGYTRGSPNPPAGEIVRHAASLRFVLSWRFGESVTYLFSMRSSGSSPARLPKITGVITFSWQACLFRVVDVSLPFAGVRYAASEIPKLIRVVQVCPCRRQPNN